MRSVQALMYSNVSGKIKTIAKQSSEHARVLSFETESGKTIEIIFDQGFGYWTTNTPHKADFKSYPELQYEYLKNTASGLQLLNQNQNPTRVYVVIKMKPL
jgi:hypothetical protein